MIDALTERRLDLLQQLRRAQQDMNGVLTITIAKTPEAQAATRQIPVRRG